MGFEIDFHVETYAFAHRDRDLTHLTLEADSAPGKLYIHCEDANEMAEAWRKAGLESLAQWMRITARGRDHTSTPMETSSGSGHPFGSPPRLPA